jgi:hypothetical protein
MVEDKTQLDPKGFKGTRIFVFVKKNYVLLLVQAKQCCRSQKLTRNFF